MIQKCGSNEPIIRIRFDDNDPADRKQTERAAGADYWATMGALARKRAEDEQRDRTFEKVITGVRAEILERAALSGRSPGAGEWAPLVQLRYLGRGFAWPR